MASKIVARKTVFWDFGTKEFKGKVKQIFADKALIQGEDKTDYIVQIACLRTKSKNG